MRGLNLFYQRNYGVSIGDYSRYIKAIKEAGGVVISKASVSKLIRALKRNGFWDDSVWNIPSTGGFKTAEVNNRNVVDTAYSVIPTGGDPAFLSQDFVTPGEPGQPNYNDCPELTKAVVGDKIMDVVAVERKESVIHDKNTWTMNWGSNPILHESGSPTGGRYCDIYREGNIYTRFWDGDDYISKLNISCYVKINSQADFGSTFLRFRNNDWVKPWDGRNNTNVFDISNGQISLVDHSDKDLSLFNSFITPLENGWYYVGYSIDNSTNQFWREREDDGKMNETIVVYQFAGSSIDGNPTVSIADLMITDGDYNTLYIPKDTTSPVTRLAPNPQIKDFIPETGSISMIADVVIDEFETETFGEPGNEVEGIIKPGTTLFSSNNSNMTIRITKDLLIVGGEDELSLNDIHYHGLELEEFQRYQFGTILSFNGDMYTLFLLYLEDDSWKVRAFYGVRDITSDTHRDLFIGCDSAGNQTSVRVLNMYSTEERLTNLLEASNLFSVLTIGNLEVKKDEIERPNILYISGDSSGTSSTRRIGFTEGTQVRIFSTNNLTISGLMSDDSTITGNDGEWSDWFSVDSTANKDFTTNGSGYIEIKGNVKYLYLSTLPNVTLAGDISNLDKLTTLYLRTLPNVTLAGDISNLDKLTTIYLSTLPNVTLAGDISNMDKLTYLYLRTLPNVTLAGDISGKKFTRFRITGISNPMTFNGYFNSNSIQTLLDYELANPGKALFNFPLNLTFVSLTINGSYAFKIAYGNFDESSAKGLIHAGWDLAVNNKLWGNVDPPRIRTFDISGCDPEDPPGLEDQISDGVTVQDALTAIYNYGATITVPAGWTEIKTFLSGLGV
jgi:hypothetical protein